MNEQTFTVMEFSGRGDAMFGGSSADWSLYTQEDGSNAFMSAVDAQRRQLTRYRERHLPRILTLVSSIRTEPQWGPRN